MIHDAHGHWIAEAGNPAVLPPLDEDVRADVAIVGEGFLRVSDGGGETLLTRAGRMVVNAKGHLALANNENYEVLDPKGKPITLAGVPGGFMPWLAETVAQDATAGVR